jgi:hypothetical protein
MLAALSNTVRTLTAEDCLRENYHNPHFQKICIS